jgi:hypothetical protein
MVYGLLWFILAFHRLDPRLAIKNKSRDTKI